MSGLYARNAEEYDSWHLKNNNYFTSKLNLLALTLQGAGEDILSVGCGTGFFEKDVEDKHGIKVKFGLEPNAEVAKIARSKGIDVKVCKAEDYRDSTKQFDAIYFNGSSTYISDLLSAYNKAFELLKPEGSLIILDVPKGSGLGLVYKLASTFGTWNHEFLKDIEPENPLPIDFMHGAVWHSTEETLSILRDVGFTKFSFAQTSTTHPKHINEYPEDPTEGFNSGNFVAIIAEK